MTLRVEMIPLDKVIVQIARQRDNKDVSDILPSIAKHGVITPIIVTENIDGDYALIAGERRLLASKQAGLKEIPARFLADLDRIERQVIELEENLHRKDLEWKELVLSVQRIHQLHLAENPSWTILQTANSINYRDYSVGCMLRVAEELAKGDKQIVACANWSTAFNIVARKEARRADDAFNELMEEPDEREPVPSSPRTNPSAETQDPVARDASIPAESSILTGEFISWASAYSGLLFNFVHCDFPYGIGLDRSAQGNSARWGSYEDGVDAYWSLVEALVDNIDRIMAPSSHLMFWLSSDYGVIHDTISFLGARTNLHFNPKPLIWFKSDNRGILPDPKRGPRHVYETAIFASRGDRLVAQAVSDTYAAPAGDKSHQSEKSEPMLRHFFRMFLDTNTRMLDPTCGSGTSLCAADSFGASVFGLELNPEWAEGARSRLRKSRAMRKYTERKEP